MQLLYQNLPIRIYEYSDYTLNYFALILCDPINDRNFSLEIVKCFYDETEDNCCRNLPHVTF